MAIDLQKLKDNLDEALNSETEESFKAWLESKGFEKNKLSKITFSKEEEVLFLNDFAFLKQENLVGIASKLRMANKGINKIIEIEDSDIDNIFNQSRHVPLKDILFMKTQQCEITLTSYLKALEILHTNNSITEFIITK